MKRYGVLALFAFAVLAGAAVMLGGLNQDEGWYLYAANLVAEGKMPYRDFFYTQGPLLPLVYSAFTPAWETLGLLGGRLVTVAIGFLSIVFAAALARLLAPEGRKREAGVIAFMLLSCNLYHVYYLSIPKTYALAAFFAIMGFYLLAFALRRLQPNAPDGSRFVPAVFLFVSGLTMSFAAGARISLGFLLAVVGFALLFAFRRFKWSFLWFGLGGAFGLAAVYGPILADRVAFEGLCAAQQYHAARGGFDPIFTVGSLSRLVRWYLPVFILAGLGLAENRFVPAFRRPAVFHLLPLAFLAVFLVQMLAPFPYEDYQVPIMAFLAVWAAVASAKVPHVLLLTLGLTWAASFGSPLLERWTTNGQDRLWTVKKEKTELKQLQDVARAINLLDPGGKTLLTQDLYLAIESGRKVPEGLEMGPFSILSDEQWRKLLDEAPCEIAALSGYTFSVNPPVCDERPIGQQVAYWKLLKTRYDTILREEAFGQNATTLMILRRKAPGRDE